MHIRDVMTPNPRYVSPDDSIQSAAQIMRDEDTGVVPVCDNGRTVGIVTDRDIVVRAVAPGIDPQTLTVQDVMRPELSVLRDDAGVFEAAETMASSGARRLPVVTRDGDLIGIVSLDDVMRVLATELSFLVATVTRSTEREVETRAAETAMP